MLPLEWFRLFVNWCSLPILVLLGLILMRRRLYRELPIFISYVIVAALSTFVRLVAYILIAHPSFAYSKIYWGSNLIISVFAIMTVYEIFIRRLFAGFYKVRFYRSLFPIVGAAILLLTILTAILSPKQPWMLVGVIDRVVVFIRLISLGFFTLLMIAMGRSWTRYELAIVFSFGLLAATSFFTGVIWAKNPQTNKDSLVSSLPTIAWDVACMIWLIAFGKTNDSSPQDTPTPINPEVLQEAQKWEGTLKEWLATPKKKQ